MDAKLTTVRGWLNGEVLPRAETLHAIAMHFGVTAGWLLGIEGEPKHRAASKVSEPSESVLAGRIARALSDRFTSEEDILPSDFEINLAKLLDWVSEDIARRLRPVLRSAQERTTLIHNAVGLQFLVAELGRLHEKEVPENLRTRYRKVIAHAGRRAMKIQELASVPFLDVPGIGLAGRERRQTLALMERAGTLQLNPVENAMSEMNAMRTYRLAWDEAAGEPYLDGSRPSPEMRGKPRKPSRARSVTRRR